MTATPADDVRNYLIANGISAASIFVGHEPDEPDACVTVYDTGGEAPDPKFALDNPTVQVRTRDTSYMDAYWKARSIQDILLGCGQFSGNESNLYVGVTANTGIIVLERDSQNRTICVINFNVYLQPGSVGNRTAI